MLIGSMSVILAMITNVHDSYLTPSVCNLLIRAIPVARLIIVLRANAGLLLMIVTAAGCGSQTQHHQLQLQHHQLEKFAKALGVTPMEMECVITPILVRKTQPIHVPVQGFVMIM